MEKVRPRSSARSVLAAPLLAVGFLTVLPVPAYQGDMRFALALFPLAGTLVGAIVAAGGLLLDHWLPRPVVAAIMVALLLVVNGGLHLDGWMDSFDGLFGGKDPASRLSIMRDSRVGSFGVAAAISVLLVEYSCLASLSPASRTAAVLTSCTLSRWSMLLALSAFSPARSSGLAASLKPASGAWQLLAGTLLTTGVVIAGLGGVGLAIVVGSGLLVLLAGRFVTWRAGGITGDSCGALGQLTEATVLIAAVGLSR